MNPNDPINEQLSTLADGELGPNEIRFLLKAVQDRPESLAKWSRYHVARACLRKDPFVVTENRMVQAVLLQIQQEQSVRPKRRWHKAAYGAFIAASVAGLSLMFLLPGSRSITEQKPVIANATGLTTRDLEIKVPIERVSSKQWRPIASSGVSIDPQVEQYFLRHSQAIDGSTRGGFVSYVPVVATPLRNVETDR